MREEVRNKLEWLINHIEDIGLLYRESFDLLFKYEHAYRHLEGLSLPDEHLLPVNMSGYSINEESFQCGRFPTKMLLHLEDYFDPNDAEVQACLYICHQIDILKASEMLKISKYQIKSPAEVKLQQIISKAVTLAQKNNIKKQKEVQAEGKTLSWEFDNKDDDGIPPADIETLI